MDNIQTLKEKYPLKAAVLPGGRFVYRFYKNDKADKTVVLLTGGVGLSDLMLFHFDAFAKSYSVLSFDYPAAYGNNRQLAAAIAALLEKLDTRVFLVGQSYGGFLAQILAQQHPERIEGLILSNTGTLSAALDENGAQHLYAMLARLDSALPVLKRLPFAAVKWGLCRSIFERAGRGLCGRERERMMAIRAEAARSLTKEYLMHMASLLKDLETHWNMKPADFSGYAGNVLLLLSADDSTFCDSIKQALIALMPAPEVITDFPGGHLALMVHLDAYVQMTTQFIDGCA